MKVFCDSFSAEYLDDENGKISTETKIHNQMKISCQFN